MLDADSHWFSGPQGRALLDLECALVREALEDCFGWQSVQIGDRWGSRELLAGARTPAQVLLSGESADARCRLTQLPIQGDSVDCVLLPHTLEFESDPYGVLREADRILAGEGKLIILCFAPWSLWGLRALAARRGFPPGLRRLFSERRLRDWMRLLGYDVLDCRRYLFESPFSLPEAGGYRTRRGFAGVLPAGALLLKARKRMHALIPPRPVLRGRPRTVLGGLSESASANRAQRS